LADQVSLDAAIWLTKPGRDRDHIRPHDPQI